MTSNKTSAGDHNLRERQKISYKETVPRKPNSTISSKISSKPSLASVSKTSKTPSTLIKADSTKLGQSLNQLLSLISRFQDRPQPDYRQTQHHQLFFQRLPQSTHRQHQMILCPSLNLVLLKLTVQ